MKSDLDFNNFQSPFSWRYGSGKMRKIFSEVEKRKTWRKVWVALAKAQHKLNLVSSQELADIQKYQEAIDINKAHEIERKIKHDLVAELKTFAGQAKIGGGKLHLGATSQDVEDNADIILFKQAILLIELKLKDLLLTFAKRIEKNRDLVCMAYTHLQPAQPTTLGYRFSLYAQDLIIDWQLLQFIKSQTKGKGIKGAVGNAASFIELVGQKAKILEEDTLKELGIEAFDVTSQVYPRKIDYLIIVALSSIAASLYKFAFDVRIMQSLGFGEWMESFEKNQVGSSAMPFKRNPQNSERLCSLSRYISTLPKVAWDNAANSLLERTLDDSAARRIIVPEAFLATDEILILATQIIENLQINNANIQKNLKKYAPFSAVEKIIIYVVKMGADRQKAHEVLRNLSLQAYEAMQDDQKNPLVEIIARNIYFKKYLKGQNLKELSNYQNHTGLASEKSKEIVGKIRSLF